LRLKQGKVIVALFAMKGGTSGGQQQWPKPNAELEARGKRSKKPVGPTKQKRPHFVRSSHDWGSHRDAESDKGAACRFWGRSGVYSNPPAGERRLPGESSECPFSMFSEAPETICTSRTFGRFSPPPDRFRQFPSLVERHHVAHLPSVRATRPKRSLCSLLGPCLNGSELRRWIFFTVLGSATAPVGRPTLRLSQALESITNANALPMPLVDLTLNLVAELLLIFVRSGKLRIRLRV